jgi:hypothetical protein
MNKQVRKIAYLVIILSLIVSGVLAGLRMQLEKSYNTIEIAIRYTDVISISTQLDLSIEEVLVRLKEAGATSLFVRENTVIPAVRGEYSNYKEQGMATYYEGYDLRKFYPEANGSIQNQLLYIETFDQEVEDNIYRHLLAKHSNIKKVQIQDKTYLELKANPSVLATIGVGFNQKDLQIAADLGYTISPQIRSWTNVTAEGLAELKAVIEEIENIGTLYFADRDIPGASSETMKELIGAHGLGFVEFFSEKQKGFETLAKRASEDGLNYKVKRLHTVADNEILTYNHQTLLERYMLALTERNMNVFLFKMPITQDIDEDIVFLEKSIENFRAKSIKQGYEVVSDKNFYNLFPGNYIVALLVGLAAITVCMLLFDFLGYTKIGYIVGACGFVGYAGLLTLSPLWAVKLMALFGSIIFPTYGVLSMLQKETRTLIQSIKALLCTCGISFGGALTIIGCLSRTSFGLGVDLFTGVKLAHLIPIVLIVIFAFYKQNGLDFSYLKQLLFSKVTYLALGLGAVALLILYVYTSRTGNAGSVSTIELQFRQFLNATLGVRPRTKELLIGHPMLLILFYYGYKDKWIPLLVLGAIGQISLVNTYAHIHTPVLISLIRSVYGIGFGIVIGIVGIYCIKIISQVINKWIKQIA